MSGLLTHIQRMEWQLFITCTYRNSRTMAESARKPMMFQFLRRLAEIGSGQGRRSFDGLLWIIREEYGEQTERLHWHGLAAGLPSGVVTPKTCLFMMGYWEGIGGGMSRIRVYDEEQDGSSYLVKDLEGLDATTQGANSYEVGKFQTYRGDSSLMLIPSNSLLAQWKRNAFESGGLRFAHDRRKSARCDLVNP